MVALSGEQVVPWWLKWLGNVAEIAAGDRVASDVILATALGALIVIAAAFWLARWLMGSRGQKMSPSDGLLLGAIGVVVFALILLGSIIWLRISPPNSKGEIATAVTTSPETVSPDFVKNQNVGMEYTGNRGLQPAIRYSAQFSSTAQQRLRIFLEWAPLNPTSLLWSPAQKISLGEFHDYIKDQSISLTLVARTENDNRQYEFWWGEPKDNLRFGFDFYRARIDVLADDGREQHFYFMVLTRKINDFLYPEIMRIEPLSFPTFWEAQDAKH